MVDKFLDISTKIFAIILIAITVVLLIKLYQNKYMLVKGQEQTLKNSIYSAKDLELAISDMDLNNKEFTLTAKNKSGKELTLEITSLKLNGMPIETSYRETVDSHTTLESLIDIEEFQSLDKLTGIDIQFKVNDTHNIDLTLNIKDSQNNEQDAD